MFALWYGSLVYKGYKEYVQQQLTAKKPSEKETAVVSPSRIPVLDPPKQAPVNVISAVKPPSSSHSESSNDTSPSRGGSFKPKMTSSPIASDASATISQRPVKIEAPPKPPRSPSPHPLIASKNLIDSEREVAVSSEEEDVEEEEDEELEDETI